MRTKKGRTSTTRAPKKLTGQNVFQRAVGFTVSFSRFWPAKSARGLKVQTRADQKALHHYKDIVEAHALKEIVAVDDRIRAFIAKRALPGPVFRAGVYLLPATLIKDTEEKLAAFATERQGLVDEFIESFPALKKRSKARLRDLYHESDYPSEAKLRASFSLRVDYITFDTPDILKLVDGALYDEHKTKMQTAWAETGDTIQTALRSAMAEMVGHLVERLEPDAQGKVKRFKQASVSVIEEFLMLFRDRNITDDTQMEKLVQKAQEVLHAGVTAETLRTDDTYREHLRKEFAQIHTTLTGMLEDVPSRQISFEAE